MAYPSSPASATYNALEWMLGSPANVRVLRELCLRNEAALSGPVLADMTRLSRPAVWKALKDLTASGIVAASGSARSLNYSLDRGHPFASSLTELFSTEFRRFQEFLKAVKRTAGRFAPEIEAVWLFGSVSRQEDKPQSDVDIAILIGRADQRAMVTNFSETLSALAQRYRMRPSVISLTRRELQRLSTENPGFWESFANDATVVTGAPPYEYV